MNKHIQYLIYVLKHKWFVFLAGLYTGAPLWRLLIHDWSKFAPTEWSPYVEKFYGKPWIHIPHFREGCKFEHVSLKCPRCALQRTCMSDFDRAWTHHKITNKHHWEYWLSNYQGVTSVHEIPEKYVREMVADWMGAGRAITGKWDVHEWYPQNRDRISLHSNTRLLVERLFEELASRMGIPRVAV